MWLMYKFIVHMYQYYANFNFLRLLNYLTPLHMHIVRPISAYVHTMNSL